jgi:hypothetical protein
MELNQKTQNPIEYKLIEKKLKALNIKFLRELLNR